MGRPAAGMSRIDEVVQLFLKDAGRVYVHQDANYNVTTLTDLTGRVLERSFYSPYGQLEAVISSHPFDFDDDGDVDSDEADGVEGCYGSYAGQCRRYDADGDRDIDVDDHDLVEAYATSLSGDTRWTRVPSSPRSRLGNPFAHQGLPLDAEIASYQNRARQYNPGLKRFMQRDPLGSRQAAFRGLGDEINPYVYVQSSPQSARDPSGEWPFDLDCDYCDVVVVPGDLGINLAWYNNCYSTRCWCSPMWCSGKPPGKKYTCSTVACILDRLHQAATRCGSGVTDFRISGHGCYDEQDDANGISIAGVCFTSNDISPADVVSIQSDLPPDSTIRLEGCRTADTPGALQSLANRLRRRVCGCQGNITFGPDCDGGPIVCKSPQ